jgi:hypothetical protein
MVEDLKARAGVEMVSPPETGVGRGVDTVNRGVA